MMKRLFPFYMSAFSLWSLYAATAVPNAASDYIFTTPLRPAHIRGLVMGSPPAYYEPRSEDVDWLNEAIHERRCYLEGKDPKSNTNTTLAAEFGKWDLSETNRFDRWSTAVDAAGRTNIVVGFHIVTNSPPSYGSPYAQIWESTSLIGDAASGLWNPTGESDYLANYLDPNVPLMSGARAYDNNKAWTNIYTLASFTNAVTNAASTISMAMTNGTVSVYTNKWTGFLRFPCEIVYTNVVHAGGNPIHWCHVGVGPFPGLTNAPPQLAHDYVARAFSVPAIISNDYVALRLAVRLADSPWPGANVWPTNSPAFSIASDHAYRVVYTNDLYDSLAAVTPVELESAHTVTSTNLISADWCAYKVSQMHSEWDKTVSYLDAAGGGQIAQTDVTEREIFFAEEGLTSGTAIFRTRFPAVLATIGGVNRVEVEALFAAVEFTYKDTNVTNSADRVGIGTNVVLRLDGPHLDVSGQDAVVKVPINPRAICEAAAQAAGAPSPPRSPGDPGVNRSVSWGAYQTAFVIFYRITPQSRLSGW